MVVQCCECFRKGYYGYTRNDSIFYCHKHKHPDMRKILAIRLCICNACINQATYANHGYERAEFCEIHRSPGMLCVGNKKIKTSYIKRNNIPHDLLNVFRESDESFWKQLGI